MIIGLNGKAVHFGQIGYEVYTKHNDLNRRNAYLSRATKIKQIGKRIHILQATLVLRCFGLKWYFYHLYIF
jgi:hypothetical protein